MLQTVEGRALKLSALTPKERECLRLVAQHCSSKEIARELGISKASVDTYCNRARAKLGVTSRRAAAQMVMMLERGEGVEPPVEAVAVAPPPAPAPVVAAVSVLPPLSSLGPLARLGIIVGGAVVLALAFGMLLSGLQTLNGVVEAAARAKAQAGAVQTGAVQTGAAPSAPARR
jgi:DNA-binding CsgD family transcriptional regulator